MTGSGALSAVLEDARRLGFLGPEPVERHIKHAETWASLLTPGSFLDLGSGGGIPGLALARLWPDSSAALLDSQLRRTAWLRTAVARLGFQERVRVVEGRAEDLAHDPSLREAFDLVVSRSFGRPAVSAECGSAYVRVGGSLSVSEPPNAGPERWPEHELECLGLSPARQVVREGATFVILRKSSVSPDKFPRRRNLPLRSPLW